MNFFKGKKILAVLLIIFTMFVAAGCDKPEDSITNTPIPNINNSGDGSVVMTINGFEIKESIYKIIMHEQAEELRRTHEPEEIIDYEEWFLNFFLNDIDGRNAFELVTEQTQVALREYAYLMKGAQVAGMSIASEDIADMKTEALLSIGDEYDPENPNEYFLAKYEVTREQYLDYFVSKKLGEEYIASEALKQDISQQALENEKNEYLDYYSTKTMRAIFLAATTVEEVEVKMIKAQELLTQIKNGADMSGLVAEHSEDGSEGDGIFTVSAENQEYPATILDWIGMSSVGESGIVVEYDGIYVLKYEAASFSEDADQRAKEKLGGEMFIVKYTTEARTDEYKPVINEAVFNAITRLPGDLIPDEDAVG